MNDGFEIPITYRGKEIQLPARLVPFGYTYRIEVDVSGTVIWFERDEERHWRALINPESGDPKVDAGLINAIIEMLDSL